MIHLVCARWMECLVLLTCFSVQTSTGPLMRFLVSIHQFLVMFAKYLRQR